LSFDTTGNTIERAGSNSKDSFVATRKAVQGLMSCVMAGENFRTRSLGGEAGRVPGDPVLFLLGQACGDPYLRVGGRPYYRARHSTPLATTQGPHLDPHPHVL
jgi:hypothetical protein